MSGYGLVCGHARARSGLGLIPRRLPGFADRYVAMVREAAAQRLHAPTGLVGSALTFPLYSLLLSHTLDRAEPGTAMGASGASLLKI